MKMYDDSTTPDELRETERVLDAMGKVVREKPDDGFDGRVLDAVGGVFDPAPLVTVRRDVVPVFAMRLAAAVALLVGVSAIVWFGVRPNTQPNTDPGVLASAESDVDLLVELFGDDDQSGAYDAFGGQIELVGLEARDDGFWATFEALSETLGEGAI